MLLLGDIPAGLTIDPAKLFDTIAGLADDHGWTVARASDATDIAPESVAAVISFDAASNLPAEYTGRPALLVTNEPVGTDGPYSANLYFPDSAVDRQAMLSGYIAALITYDWRVAALTVPSEESVRDAILAGAGYMCGLCRPTLPPYAGYPLSIRIDPQASSSQISETISELERLGVQTVVLSPQATQANLVSALAQRGIRMLGMQETGELPASSWAATIRYAPEQALAAIWEPFTSGDPVPATVIALAIENRNAEHIPEARLRLALETAQDISLGLISTQP